MLKPIGFLLILCFMTAAQAGFGVCEYGKQTISSLICYGPAVLKKTQVAGNTQVFGPLKATDASLDVVQVKGIIELKNSKINGPLSLVGFLTAEHSIFTKDITLISNQAIFRSSLINGSITMASKRTQPVLNLFCRTEVTGSVVFPQKAGVVRMTKDSILRGQITNGRIEMVERTC